MTHWVVVFAGYKLACFGYNQDIELLTLLIGKFL
jgi:hypothetical protein